jgi:hypothetical protein
MHVQRKTIRALLLVMLELLQSRFRLQCFEDIVLLRGHVPYSSLTWTRIKR